MKWGANINTIDEHRFCQKAKNVIARLYREDKKNKNNFIGIFELLESVLCEKGSVGKATLRGIGITKSTLKKCKKSIRKREKFVISRIITRAFRSAMEFGYPYVGTEHLVFAALTDENSESKTILKFHKIAGKEGLNEKLKMMLGNKDDLASILKIFDISNENLFSESTPKKNGLGKFSESYCIDLTSFALKKDAIVGRENEIERLINILNRKEKNNPLLVGEPGVGKTAIVEELSRHIADHRVPHSLLGKRILSLDLGLLVAGTTYRGEFEQRLKNVIRDAASDPNIIIFIDEIHTLVGAGNVQGALDAANILKPALSRGEIRVIGATTFDEYKKYIEKDGALDRRFQVLTVKEPNLAECERMLLQAKGSYEKFHGVTITDSAIKAAVILSDRYILHKRLPDKALDLLDEAASWKKSCAENKNSLAFKKITLSQEIKDTSKKKSEMVIAENYEEALALKDLEAKIAKELRRLEILEKSLEIGKKKVEVTEDDVIHTLSKNISVSPSRIRTQKKATVKSILKNLSKKIIGQPNAVSEIASTLMRAYSGISNYNRPLGSFIFLGPSGVGKTYSAKIIAEEFFPERNALIRLDMSEFMEKHNVSRLIGAPAGYIGYGEGGILTEKIKHNPNSVILFDEIEKAHRDVLNILLQILEDGYLTDAAGKTVSFKNSIIILTSNLGTEFFSSRRNFGFLRSGDDSRDFEIAKSKVEDFIKKELRPELLNRLDKVIVFQPLDKKSLVEIASLELERLTERLRENNIEVSFDRGLAEALCKDAAGKTMGARFIRKNIEKMIENQLAEMILERPLKNIESFSIIAAEGKVKVIAK